MGAREEREPYLRLIEACLVSFFDRSAEAAQKQVDQLRRSRRVSWIEHIEAFYVAYDLAHPEEQDERLRVSAADQLLKVHRTTYDRLMVQTGFLPADVIAEAQARRQAWAQTTGHAEAAGPSR